MCMQVDANVMRSFVEACLQQAKAGAGAHHATLHDEVRTLSRIPRHRPAQHR